jgi:hypothetical protein
MFYVMYKYFTQRSAYEKFTKLHFSFMHVRGLYVVDAEWKLISHDKF